MTAYIIRRLLWIIPVLFAITLITFTLMHLVKGGPFEPGDAKASEAGRAALVQKYHLNDPVYVQYVNYMKSLMQGDFGPDLKNPGLSVNEILARNWKPTVELGIYTTIYVMVFGISMGVLAAIKKNSWMDYLSVGFATVGASVPNFVLGIMLVLLLATGTFPIIGGFKWLPAVGWKDGFMDWKPVILPVLALGSLPAAYIARLTRASVLEVMNQDYVRTARAKGLREQVVLLRHIVRNAMIPVVTLIGPIVATLVTGSFIIEYFFAIPGIGRLYVQSIGNRDYPLIMATTLIYAVVIAVANLTVDIMYSVLDPRIKYS